MPPSTHVFVGNNLHTLHMARGLKNLLQNVFRDPGVEAANIESPLIRLWSSTTYISTCCVGRRHQVPGHWGGNRCRDWVCILRNHHGRRRHVGWIALAIALLLLAGSASRWLRRRGKARGGRGRRVFCHGERRSRRVMINGYKLRESTGNVYKSGGFFTPAQS